MSYIGAGLLHYILVQGSVSYIGAGLLHYILVQGSVSYIGAGLLHYILVQGFCVLYWCRPVALYTGAGVLSLI